MGIPVDDVMKASSAMLQKQLYAIFTSPDRAADIVKTSGDILVDGVRSIGTFFDALLS